MRPEAVAAMAPFFAGTYGNPSGGHAIARAAKTALEAAREEIAHLLGAAPAEIVFTGGGTEADNLAVKGAARAGARRGPGRRRRHHRVRAQGCARVGPSAGRRGVPGHRSGGRRRRHRERRRARRRDRRPHGRGVGDARQQRDRHHPAARRDRGGRARARTARGGAHRRGTGGAVARRGLRLAAPPTSSRSRPTSSADPRVSARSWCATASASFR